MALGQCFFSLCAETGRVRRGLSIGMPGQVSQAPSSCLGSQAVGFHRAPWLLHLHVTSDDGTTPRSFRHSNHPPRSQSWILGRNHHPPAGDELTRAPFLPNIATYPLNFLAASVARGSSRQITRDNTRSAHFSTQLRVCAGIYPGCLLSRPTQHFLGRYASQPALREHLIRVIIAGQADADTKRSLIPIPAPAVDVHWAIPSRDTKDRWPLVDKPFAT